MQRKQLPLGVKNKLSLFVLGITFMRRWLPLQTVFLQLTWGSIVRLSQLIAVFSRFTRKLAALKHVPAGFAYSSGTNTDFLTVDQLPELIRCHVDPEFQPI